MLDEEKEMPDSSKQKDSNDTSSQKVDAAEFKRQLEAALLDDAEDSPFEEAMARLRRRSAR